MHLQIAHTAVGLALAAPAVVAAPAQIGPCDIYAAGKTPCVAAHSTTRALFGKYTGPLYSVSRSSDRKTINISPLSPGGVANAAAQDHFCAKSACLITTIYDQSGHNNHLTAAPPGGAAAGPNPGGYDNVADATLAPVMLSGQKVYGVYIAPGSGYRNDTAVGTATGDEPQGIYAILDGTHYNDGCCFDYGNAEVSNDDTGAGHMEAIYFGNNTIWGRGTGPGPWIMTDQENGLFGGRTFNANPNNPSQTNRFISAFVKGQPNHWAIHGGNGQVGTLATYYNGARPDGYNPMHKEGAIILGIGGDNSNGAQGTFYEGAMTFGFPSLQTEQKVQANVVAAKYTIV